MLVHEAGHAVAAFQYRLPIRSIDIVPEGAACDIDYAGTTDEDHAVILAAGAAAERVRLGSNDWQACTRDEKAIADLKVVGDLETYIPIAMRVLSINEASLDRLYHCLVQSWRSEQGYARWVELQAIAELTEGVLLVDGVTAAPLRHQLMGEKLINQLLAGAG
jgi:hypothetical protein